MNHILTEMLRERVGSSFDNEATFSADEVKQIIAALEKATPSPLPQLAGSQIEEEDRREQKLATIVAPDNGTPDEVLFAVLECATAWVLEARIIGNVRAGDIVRAVRAARAAMGRAAISTATPEKQP